MDDLATRRRRGMPLLARRGRQRGTPAAGDPAGWFGAVAEALAEAAPWQTACDHAGRGAARDGADLVVVLDALRYAVWTATGREPSYAMVRAVALSWSEETLSWVHQLPCTDPLTGLATPAHLRARLGELYRSAVRDGAPTEHALVVVDVPRAVTTGALGSGLALLGVAERLRLAFTGDETLCRVDDSRLLVLVRRTDELPGAVQLAAALLRGSGQATARVWVEGLPDAEVAAGHLLDELIRTGSCG